MKKQKNKGNKRPYITYEDRVVIERMLNAKEKQKRIAKVIKRGESTLSEEIKKGKCSDGIYRFKKAQHRAYIRQYNKKRDCLKVSESKELTSGKAIRKFIKKKKTKFRSLFVLE
ncbi:helix-turn-helix domain-containing protein [Patescibacteria group bacterium]